MYSSFGECIPCEEFRVRNTSNVSSSSSSSVMPDDVRSLTIIVLVAIFVCIFLIVFASVFLAEKKHGGTIRNGFNRAREFVTFLFLSMQTASYVGPVQKVAGDGAVTPVHRVAFGVYEAFGLDTEAIAPSMCETNMAGASDTMEIVLLLTTPAPWAAAALCLFAPDTELLQSRPGKFFASHSIAVLSIVYGRVCSVVFAVLSGWRPFAMETIVLAWCTVPLYCVGFPLCTFMALKRVGCDRQSVSPENTRVVIGDDVFTTEGTRRRSMTLQGMVKYATDDSWFLRHLHFLAIFCLALDRRVFSVGLSNLAQICSVCIGVAPCLVNIVLLVTRRRFLLRHRWMGWTRVGIFVQVSLGYMVKCAGYFTMAEENRVGLVVFAWVWGGMYICTLAVMMVGFAYCICVGAKHEAKQQGGGGSGPRTRKSLKQRMESNLENEASSEISVPVAEVGAAPASAALNPLFAGSKGLQEGEEEEEEEGGELGTLPASVSEHFDEATGHKYYYDSETQESSWTRSNSKSLVWRRPAPPRSSQSSTSWKSTVSANSLIASEYLEKVAGSASN